jgi:hypothetical protein
MGIYGRLATSWASPGEQRQFMDITYVREVIADNVSGNKNKFQKEYYGLE